MALRNVTLVFVVALGLRLTYLYQYQTRVIAYLRDDPLDFLRGLAGRDPGAARGL